MAAEALHIRADNRTRALCVLVHGRGQSPEEMQSHIVERLDVPDVTFVLPRAEGGVWYEARAVDPLTLDARTALEASLEQLAADIAETRATYGEDLPLVLAGFSQGACLSLEYAFSGRPSPEALVAFTGCRVGVAADDRPHALSDRLPVYLTGSDADPWIPIGAFCEATRELGEGRARLRTDVWPGRAHEVADAEITMLQSILTDLAAGEPVTMAAAR
jgi:phospholipase/carboxylesterase